MPHHCGGMALHLLSGESLVTTERQHVAVLVPVTLVAVICLGLPLILIQLVPDQVSSPGVNTPPAAPSNAWARASSTRCLCRPTIPPICAAHAKSGGMNGGRSDSRQAASG